MTGPDDAVPPPLTPRAAGDIRTPQVVAGFFLGGGLAWSLRFVLMEAAEEMSAGAGPILLAAFGPTVVLLCTMWWCATHGRRGWAVGMAIYAAVAGLLAFGVGAYIWIACSGTRI